MDSLHSIELVASLWAFGIVSTIIYYVIIRRVASHIQKFLCDSNEALIQVHTIIDDILKFFERIDLQHMKYISELEKLHNEHVTMHESEQRINYETTESIIKITTHYKKLLKQNSDLIIQNELMQHRIAKVVRQRDRLRAIKK